jgi:putative transposase
VYCAVVLDTFSRRVVGRPIDAGQTSALVTNALSMAMGGRTPDPKQDAIILLGHGVQYMSWVFTKRALDSGPAPSIRAPNLKAVP